MLRMYPQSRSDDAKRYYASADYYTEGQELVGEWGGKAAERLGLNGVVARDAFNALCDNLDPNTGKRLTPRTRADRTVGYDLTFDGPKSLSVLYGLTGDERILEAFRASVREEMVEIEQDMHTRVRKRGQNANRKTSNMVWAEFVHFTARPVDGIPDPQLHCHCFTFNQTWDEKEQQWKAGNFQDIKRDAPYHQAAFHARLARKLVALGYGIERTGKTWEIAGIPSSVIDKFSRRYDQIEAEARERGITDPAEKAKLAAQTREHKNKNLTLPELRQYWAKQLDEGEGGALERVYAKLVPKEKGRSPISPSAAVSYGILHSFERSAVVSEKQLLGEALRYGIGDVLPEEVRAELLRRPLIVEELEGRRMATTEQMLNDESRMIAFARDGRGRHYTLGNPDRKFIRDWLNDEQKAAVRHVLDSRDRVTMIRGVAGTGKTTLEQELRDAFAEDGRPVVALAATAAASRGVLREAGFAGADTIARFFSDKEMQASAAKGVVLVDEASLLGTRDMAKLFDIAGVVGARVVLVGDNKQHKSAAAGEPLRLLQERGGMPVVEVKQIQRQTDESYKRAVKLLSEGNTAEAFALLDKMGWIQEVKDEERYRQLAGDYVRAAAERKKNGEQKTVLVVSPTHAEGNRITAAIRAELRAKYEALRRKQAKSKKKKHPDSGKFKDEKSFAVWVPAHLTEAERGDKSNYKPGDMLQFHQNAPGHKRGERLISAGQDLPVGQAARFQVYRPASLNVAVGDRLRISANGKSKDGKHRLDNGDFITVKGFTRQGDIVDDRGWVISRDFGHLTYGYVVTSHASQGKSVDKVLIGQSATSLPASNLSQFYVSVSRGKAAAKIYTDDKQALLEAVRRADTHLSATELARKKAAREQAERFRHLQFMRRQALFEELHPYRSAEQERGQQREMNYER